MADLRAYTLHPQPHEQARLRATWTIKRTDQSIAHLVLVVAFGDEVLEFCLDYGFVFYAHDVLARYFLL